MEGDLREFQVPEILQFISLSGRSGMLEVVRRDGALAINFTGGTITGLTADGWTLGSELRESGLVPPDALEAMIAAGPQPDDLRAAVLTGGYMTVEEWTVFVARQVERLLYPLFDARDGTFRFRPAGSHPGPWLPVHVSADRAVLEGTRWSETWARASERVPSRQSRFVRSPLAPRRAIKVSHTQWRVYVALGRAGNVPQAAARAVLTEVEVVEAIQSLLDSGLICPALPAA